MRRVTLVSAFVICLSDCSIRNFRKISQKLDSILSETVSRNKLAEHQKLWQTPSRMRPRARSRMIGRALMHDARAVRVGHAQF